MDRFRRWRRGRRLAAEWLTVWALRDGREHFGTELRAATGIRYGRLYPTLTRLEQQGLVRTGWEDASVRLHPRRWYALTPEGLFRVELRVSTET